MNDVALGIKVTESLQKKFRIDLDNIGWQFVVLPAPLIYSEGLSQWLVD